MNSNTPQSKYGPLPNAAPFWISLTLIPLALCGAIWGGWAVCILPLYTWYLFSGLDFVFGRNNGNPNPDTELQALAAHHLITLIWAPLQFLLLFGMIWYVPQAEHLSTLERGVLFFGVGVITGTVGINYSHELMHQRHKMDRWLADILLAMVLYSHFRSEHLLVHHRYVGTPTDAVTARYNEGFYRFFPRVLHECLSSAFNAERAMLARKNLSWQHRSNPFFKYWTLQGCMLILAFSLGGLTGVLLFLLQAATAIWQLELVNYIEHYGLTRRHLGEGKYEHVLPQHSWNADHRATNWLLLNLQRHSDHHFKPSRPYPVLQTYDADTAPQLPFGYPVMTVTAMVPSLWRRVMNPRVQSWRDTYYPDIDDWAPYDMGTNPRRR
ncbi:MAG: alkane 1-monooxygenase [Roseobacter sp.]